MLFDRIRLQRKLKRDLQARQANTEQYLVEMMDTQIKWERDELLSKARLPLFDFTEIFNKLQADGLIEVKQSGPARHYQPTYCLTNQGRQMARHTKPRS